MAYYTNDKASIDTLLPEVELTENDYPKAKLMEDALRSFIRSVDELIEQENKLLSVSGKEIIPESWGTVRRLHSLSERYRLSVLDIEAASIEPDFQANGHISNYRQFRLASKYDNFSYLQTLLQQMLNELGLATNQDFRNTVTDNPYGLNSAACFNIYCNDHLIEALTQDFEQIPSKKRPFSITLAELFAFAVILWCRLTYVKYLIITAIRIQYIAKHIRNRTSRSPAPCKKEPPVGGVKVGGEHLTNIVMLLRNSTYELKKIAA